MSRLKIASLVIGLFGVTVAYCDKFDEGLVAHKKGHYKHALKLWLPLAEKSNAKHLTVAKYNFSLGLDFAESKKYRKAIPFLTKSVNMSLKSLGSRSIYIARIYRKIGETHKEIGEYKNAIDYFKKSLKIAFVQSGPEYNSKSLIYYQLAQTYSKKSDHKQTKAYANKAVDMATRGHGIDHEATKNIQNT